MTIPKFNPRIYFDSCMGLFYEDDRVIGAIDQGVDGDRRTTVISEWSSLFPGNGFTKEALQWIRAQGFAVIAANGVGMVEDGVGDIATAYWQHMHSQGLVDVLIDDEGSDITPQAERVGQLA